MKRYLPWVILTMIGLVGVACVAYVAIANPGDLNGVGWIELLTGIIIISATIVKMVMFGEDRHANRWRNR
jgi:high-affinity Fe2+/Pb2+ permease